MFFGPQAASPPKKTPGRVDCMVVLVHHRHVPFVELDAEVALDPGERVLLADGENHVVGRKEDGVDDLGFLAPSASHSRRSNSMPVSLPFSITKRLGA